MYALFSCHIHHVKNLKTRTVRSMHQSFFKRIKDGHFLRLPEYGLIFTYLLHSNLRASNIYII